MDDLNAWRRHELLWTLRWLAADADAALAAYPGIVTCEEIALDIDDWTRVAHAWGLVDAHALVLLDEINREFDEMRGSGRPELWEDEALRSAPERLAQRGRARAVLDATGEERADSALGSPRPGGPTYVPGRRRRSL